jgi:2-oxoglutarate ferredoxin oxidoreductase subunit gamma
MEPMTREMVAGKLAIGRFRQDILPEYTRRYAELCDRARAAAKRERESPDAELPPRTAALPRDPYQVRFSGEGGQGVILAGVLLADAACAEGLQAVHTQSYGPEARGGACKSEVVLSTEPIAFPEVDQPDVVICLSSEAMRKYPAAPDGIRLVEERACLDNTPAEHDLVLPMIKVAVEAGGELAVNVVALGALAGLTGIASREALLAGLRRRVRSESLPLNERALDAGLRLGGRAAVHSVEPRSHHPLQFDTAIASSSGFESPLD